MVYDDRVAGSAALAGPDGAERRGRLLALLAGLGAERAVREARQRHHLGAGVGVVRQEHLRVLVLRVAEDLAGAAVLDDAALVHHEDALGGLEDDAEVVADQDRREALGALQLDDRVHHGVLHEHVERRRRLVEHHELRLERERQGDGHALPHTAGELPGEPGEHRGRQLHLLDELLHPGVPAVARHVAVRPEDVDEVVPDRAHRVERVHAGLQHHGEAALPLLAQGFVVEVADVLAREDDAAAVRARRRLLQPGQRVAERRLARTGLADQADELALL
ncbi:hypothetical protein BACI9J_760002 [Bacillus altitudinis]|nr:hypothetical protein BACI9J_760002 [Bacillus altitudinis]